MLKLSDTHEKPGSFHISTLSPKVKLRSSLHLYVMLLADCVLPREPVLPHGQVLYTPSINVLLGNVPYPFHIESSEDWLQRLENPIYEWNIYRMRHLSTLILYEVHPGRSLYHLFDINAPCMQENYWTPNIFNDCRCRKYGSWSQQTSTAVFPTAVGNGSSKG